MFASRPDPGPDRSGFVHDAAATRVVFAPGALARVGEEVTRLDATRVLLIAGRHEAGYADRVAADLGGRVAARVGEVVMHVPVEVAGAAVTTARASGAEAVLSIGGGSATGLAKAVALETGLPVVAVPTTYAGSEMTPTWGLTAGEAKSTGRDPRVQPRVVIYDPELTVTLPAATSAASGMNALAHCVEALYARAVSPVTRLLAADGARALAGALPRVVSDGADLDARGEALYGAWLAGWALGLSAMGVHHKLCHVLGGTYRLPHAEVHAVILPYAAAFNAPYAAAAMATVADAIGGTDGPGGLWDLGRRLGIPASLTALGFDPDQAGQAAGLVAQAAPANPRPVDRDGIQQLLLAACAGTRP
jgi:maleylacetate reductase